MARFNIGKIIDLKGFKTGSKKKGQFTSAKTAMLLAAAKKNPYLRFALFVKNNRTLIIILILLPICCCFLFLLTIYNQLTSPDLGQQLNIAIEVVNSGCADEAVGNIDQLDVGLTEVGKCYTIDAIENGLEVRQFEDEDGV